MAFPLCAAERHLLKAALSLPRGKATSQGPLPKEGHCTQADPCFGKKSWCCTKGKTRFRAIWMLSWGGSHSSALSLPPLAPTAASGEAHSSQAVLSSLHICRAGKEGIDFPDGRELSYSRRSDGLSKISSASASTAVCGGICPKHTLPWPGLCWAPQATSGHHEHACP